MKTLFPLTALAALIASSAAFAQTPAYSKPSGYTTQVLRPNATNYVGINVVTPSLASGSITGLQGGRLVIVDSNASFTSSLQAGKMHTIEITSGAAVGSIREFTTFTNTGVTTTAVISGLQVGDKYIIRKNLTLQEMFPQGAPLTGGAVSPGTADIVRVPDGAGGFTSYFYKTTSTNGEIGWWTAASNTARGVRVTADVPLLYTDGIQVFRRSGVNKNLVLTGQVKTTSSSTYLVTGSNPVSINAPVGANLSNSALSLGMQPHATSPVNADILWVPQSNGTFKRYWRKNSNTGGLNGWYLTPDGIALGTRLTTGVVLPPYCMIERKGAPRFVQIKVPAHYSNL
ncbi:MAG: hypothetical protein RLZZ505_12 [Verrucomicrobiota bacterium]|jgi:hypothetical protein